MNKKKGPVKEEQRFMLQLDANDGSPMDTKFEQESNLTAGFTKERVFAAAASGNTSELKGLLEYLKTNKKRLTSPEFIEERNGKTALLKALLSLKEKDDGNETIEVLLDIAAKTDDLNELINASYTDRCNKGQTALHVAIERRNLKYVKLLVEKGANLQAKANGKFFQLKKKSGFYFGELPLSLAACTNQPDVVSYLLDRGVDVEDTDSEGNTVLHALVVIDDNNPKNTDMIGNIYDKILTVYHKLHSDVRLEEIKNKQGFTPLKLAAKLGKKGLLKHMLHREFLDKESRPLSRKFTEWVYGPVHSSLFDTSSIDTDEDNSVLEILVFSSQIPNRTEMLQLEPLQSLLKDKWDRFASKLFLLRFVFYMIYLSIFTAVAMYRKEGKPPFPIEDVPVDYLRSTGEVISVLGALWFFYKAVVIFKRKPPMFNSLYTHGFNDILFFLQATLLLFCIPLYWLGHSEYVGLMVISLALSWVNVLYYSRGIKQLGIYNVMMQRMILKDILHFLCVYIVFLFGFSAAIMSLRKDVVPHANNGTSTDEHECRSYNEVSCTVLELFKFTIGMGDLQFTDHVQYKEVFYILLILYIVLTYILLLNMLIALMGFTVDNISKESENIWNLQRSHTILDMERTLSRCMLNKLYSQRSKTVRFKQDKSRRFLRVEETDWSQWRSHMYVDHEEDSSTDLPSPRSPLAHLNPFRGRRFRPFIGRIRTRFERVERDHVV